MASSCSQVWAHFPKQDIHTLEMSWIAHTDGSFTSVETSENIDGWVLEAITDPGATQPQASYDITLSDAYGDVMGSAMLNRSATVTERVKALSGTTPITPFVAGKLTLAITANNVNGATGKVIIIVDRGGRYGL